MPTADELRKLKVADLKVILKEKGLSTVGVKEDLVKRLTEHDDESVTEPAAAEIEKDQSEDPVIEQESEVQKPDSREAEVVEENTVEEVQETAALEKPEDVNEPELNQEPSDDVTAEPENHSSYENPLASRISKRPADFSPEGDRDHEDRDVRDEPQEPKRLKTSDEPIHPVTRAIYIANLSRPLLKAEFTDFVADKVGSQPEYLWLDRLRTHAFVVFKDTDIAREAREKLHGVRYPESETMRKEMFVDFVPENKVYKWSKYEDEDKRRRPPIRFAVRYEGSGEKALAVHYEKPTEESHADSEEELNEIQWTVAEPAISFATRRM